MQRVMRPKVPYALALVLLLGLAVYVVIGCWVVWWFVRADHPGIAAMLGLPWAAMGALLGLSLYDTGRR